VELIILGASNHPSNIEVLPLFYTCLKYLIQYLTY